MIPTHQLYWADWQVNNELDQLFLLRWEELFASRTLDTWQPRALSLQDLLVELADTAAIARHHEKHRANLPFIIAEASERLSTDTVIKAAFPLTNDYLTQLANTTDLNTIESVAKFCLDYVNSYDERVVERLGTMIEAADAKPKQEFYNLILSLGTRAAGAGFSLRYLRDQLDDLERAADGNFGTRFARLASRLKPVPTRFDVHFPIDWPGPRTSQYIEGCSFDFIPPSAPPPLSDAVREFFAQYRGSQLIRVSVSAPDPFAAIDTSVRRFADLTAFLSLYKVRSGAILKGNTAMVTSDSRSPQILARPNPLESNIKDSSQTEAFFPSVLKMHGGMRAEDQGQLLAALHYHQLAVSSNSETAALVNLWIALESLTRGGEGAGSIERICRYVTPSIALDYPLKVLGGLSADIRRIWHENDKDHYLSQLHDSTATRLAPSDLLDTLRDVKDGPLIDDLYKLVGDHPLMRYRTHRYRTAIFDSPKSLRSTIISHHQRVEWQLRRIYRVRNDIVHRGQTVLASLRLVNHLHSYLIRFLNNLLATLVHNPTWSIRHAIEHRRQLYTLLLVRLEKPAGDLRQTVLQPYTLVTVMPTVTRW